MATNFIRPGVKYTVTGPSGGVSAGGVVVINDDFIGVAIDDIAEDELGAAAVKEVYELPANDNQAFSQGEVLYWDGSVLTTTSTDNDKAGVAAADKAQADPVGQVDLNVRL